MAENDKKSEVGECPICGEEIRVSRYSEHLFNHSENDIGKMLGHKIRKVKVGGRYFFVDDISE